MMYYFYMGNVLLPLTPSKLTVKTKNKNKTVDLVSGGEVNIPKSPGLTEISFDAVLPAVDYDFATYENGFKSPNYYLEYFEKLKTGKTPFDFIVIRTISAEALLRHALRLSMLPNSVVKEYDFDGDGKVTSADARILLRGESGITMLNDTNIKCVIEDYSITEDANKHGRDFSVSLSLKQYVSYGVKKAIYQVVK